MELFGGNPVCGGGGRGKEGRLGVWVRGKGQARLPLPD